MLELTPSALYDEYEAGIAKTREHLSAFDEQIKQRAGQHYSGQKPSAEVFRQNYYHKWLSYVVPQLVGRDPRLDVGALLQPDGSEQLELELAGNAWNNDNHARQFLAAGPANDMQYNFGVVACVCEPVPGARPIEGVGVDFVPGDPEKGNPKPAIPWAPKWYRVAQGRYFEDALATTRDDIRLQGHIWVRDQNSVLAEGEKGGWNVKAIQDYAADSQLDALARPENANGTQEVRRKEIVGIEMWVPEYDLEEGNPWGVPASPGREHGFHGTIFTLLVDRATAIAGKTGATAGLPTPPKKDRADMLDFPRKPRPWYGHARGPYVVFGQFTVPNDSLPLGALTACEEEIRQLNTDARIAQDMMRTFKRLILISRGTEKDVQLIKSGVHDAIYRIAGITKEDVIPAEIGGISDQALAHIEFSRNNLEGTLGLNDMHAGIVSGVGTATEQTYAENAAQARFSGIKQAFDDGVEDLETRTLWFIYEDNRYGKELGPEASEELSKRGLMQPGPTQLPDGTTEQRLPTPIYLGGQRQGVERIPFDALSIKVHSMERESEQLAFTRATILMQVTAELVQLSARYPTFPWGEVAKKIGQALHYPQLGKMFENPSEIAAGAVQVAQLMGASSAPTSAGAKQAPKTGPSFARAGGGSKPTSSRQSQKRGPAGSNRSSSKPPGRMSA